MPPKKDWSSEMKNFYRGLDTFGMMKQRCCIKSFISHFLTVVMAREKIYILLEWMMRTMLHLKKIRRWSIPVHSRFRMNGLCTLLLEIFFFVYFYCKLLSQVWRGNSAWSASFLGINLVATMYFPKNVDIPWRSAYHGVVPPPAISVCLVMIISDHRRESSSSPSTTSTTALVQTIAWWWVDGTS